jgi:FixJ family two-component response regulator
MNQSRINVAVVDDDQSFARALERLFRASGLGVHTYPSAEVLLAMIPLPQPDCFVLDIQLGGMSGLELQRQLRQLGAMAPVIFVTAHDMSGFRDQAQKAGCSAYFSKPVQGGALIDAIKKAVNPGGEQSSEPAAN